MFAALGMVSRLILLEDIILAHDISSIWLCAYLTQIELLPNQTLSLGDLVGLAFRLMRSHWREIVRSMLLPSILCSLGSNLSYYSFAGWVKVAAESKLAVGPFATHMSLCFCGILLWLYAAWRLFFCSRVLARRIYCGYGDSAQADRELKPKRWTLFGVYNLTIVPVSVVLLFWLLLALACFGLVPKQEPAKFWVGGVIYAIIGFWFTVSIAMTSLYGALVESACVIDLRSVGAALKRGWYLFGLRSLRGGSYECLKWFTLILLGFAIETPAIVASTIAEIVDKSHTPPALIAFNAIFDVILNMVYASFAAVANMLFYRDLKLRLEGVDLVERLESIQAVQSASKVQE